MPLISRSGDLYFADSRTGTATIRRISGDGRQMFEVRIPGVGSSYRMVLGGDGNLYVVGYADRGLPVTPGAYLASGPGSFACGLSGSDGRILFCTYIDVPDYGAFAADSQGYVYVASVIPQAGTAGSKSYALRLRPDGKLAYRVELPDSMNVVTIAPDANGNLLVAPWIASHLLLQLDPAGKVIHRAHGDPDEYVSLIAFDASQNPQVLMGSATDSEYGLSKVRRYNRDLSAVVFEIELDRFEPRAMWLDPVGATVLPGRTTYADFPQMHPTASCVFPAKPQTYPANSPRANAVLVRLDAIGRLVQSTFLAHKVDWVVTGSIGAGAGMLVLGDAPLADYALALLGPMPEVRVACLGNAASLGIRPLAPEGLVSIFGQDIGPANPAIGRPGPGNRYPAQLEGIQVTFDGVAAPLFYVSGKQINAVTPRSLAGRETTRVCVLIDGVRTNCIEAPVRPASPGIFTSGKDDEHPHAGVAAAINQDGTINSKEKPAPVGSVVSIFATGLGTITPALQDGDVVGLPLPYHELPVKVYVVVGVDKNRSTYRLATVRTQYVGPAPMQIKGLTQINLEVPATGELLFLQLAEFEPYSAATDVGVRIWIKR